MNDFAERASALSLKNRTALEETTVASCYGCLMVFPRHSITEWSDDGQTARCPRCDIDSVVPGDYPVSDLEAACERWFKPVTPEEAAMLFEEDVALPRWPRSKLFAYAFRLLKRAQLLLYRMRAKHEAHKS